MNYRNVFVPRMPMLKSEVGQSTLMYEITPQKVTLRDNPHFRYFEAHFGEDPKERHSKTMFREIKMLPPESQWGPEIKDLVSNPPKRRKASKEKFLGSVFGIFMRVVEDAWIPEKFHVILHTSGYDSRLISYTVRKLYEKHGADWLGDIVFIEVHDERYCWDALKAEGWDESHFATYMGPIDLKSCEHHIRSCDFANAWKRQNCGMSPIGFNFWYEPVEWLQELGRIPSDDSQLQGWSGVLANGVAYGLINGPGLEWVLRTLPYHPYFLGPTKGEWVVPFLSLDLIRILWEYGMGQEESKGGQDNNYRRHILDLFAPEVGRVPRRRGMAQRRLSQRLREQMRRDYLNSWYGQNVAPDIEVRETIQRGMWWGHWGLASYCEELHRRGHDILLPQGEDE